MKNKIHIKKGDNVVVISGKDKDKKGKVLSVGVNKRTVLVEGVNMATKHQKPNGANQGGIVHQEAPIHVSNVMYLHDGKPTRVGIKSEVKTVDGKEVTTRVRFAKSTGEVID